MGSLFDNSFGAFAADGLMDQFADASLVTYITGAGAASSIYAILGQEQARQEEGADSRIHKMIGRSCKIRTSATTPKWRGVDSPKLKDTVTISEVEYAVQEITGSTGSFHELLLTRPEKMDSSRPTR